MKTLKSFYLKHGKFPTLNFAEKANESLSVVLNMPPEKALEWLRKRGYNKITADKFNEILKNAHDTAFTVANILKADVLQEIYTYVERAMTEGWTYTTFQNKVVNGDLIDRMQKAGWTGKTPSRLKVIYDTNLRMAQSKGQYEHLSVISDDYPFWIYHQVHRNTKRNDHAKFDGKKFRANDPIWKRIYPPSGHGCSCWIEPTDDPSGVENGNDYKNFLSDSKDFQISPLETWEPEISKYSKGIQEALKEDLIKKQ